MKKIFLIACISLGLAMTAHAQVKVGNNPTTLNPSAALEVESTNKGFLPPRVNLTSSTDAVTISSPAQGLLVYNVNGAVGKPGIYVNNGTAASPVWALMNVYSETVGSVSAFYRGTMILGDIYGGAAPKSLPVTGYLTSAIAAFGGTGNDQYAIITVTFPSLGTTDYSVSCQAEATSGIGYNESVSTPSVITTKTVNSFTVYIREAGQVGQNYRLSILIGK